MLDIDKQYTYKQASDALEKTDTLVKEVVEAWASPQFTQAVLGEDDIWLEEVPSELRQSAINLVSLYSEVSARYAQVQSIIRDTWKIYHMSRKYPWRGTVISKSDHFHFVWLNFTHHCYLFEERVKKFYSAWDKLRHQLKLSEIKGGDHIKDITKRLSEYIKHRGVHTHQWNITHQSYRTHQILEHLAEHNDEYKGRTCAFYYETKQEIMAHVASGVGVMAEEFFELKGDPHLKLKELVPFISKTFFDNSPN